MTDERLATALTRHLDTGITDPGLGAPYDDEIVAGLITGTLADDERQRALERLAARPPLRRLLADVDRVVSAEAGRRRRFVPWGKLAAAAVLLVLVGGSIFVARKGPFSSRSSGEVTDASLAPYVAELQRDEPELFGDFAILGASERAKRAASAVERGGLVLEEPRGAVLDGRPFLRWKAPSGATRFQVTAIDAEGRTLLTAEAEGDTWLAWPSNAAEVTPGAHVVWRVEADLPGQRLVGSQTFRRLSTADEARYREGIPWILERGGSGERGMILAAHWAIRSGLLHEARTLLEDAGTSRVAEETRTWLAEMLHD